MATARTAILLLEIAKGLQDLTDGDKIEALLKKAYTLRSDFEEKIKQGKLVLAQKEAFENEMEAARAEIKKLNEELRERELVFVRDKDAFSKETENLSNQQKVLNQQRQDLEAAVAAHSLAHKDLLGKNGALAKGHALLDERSQKLDAQANHLASERKRVAEYEANLKAKAANLRMQTENL